MDTVTNDLSPILSKAQLFARLGDPKASLIPDSKDASSSKANCCTGVVSVTPPLKVVVAVASLLSLLTGLPTAAAGQVGAANKFRQLTAAQINAVVIGKVITDDAHWADHFYSDGTVRTVQMGETVRGTWRLDGNALCVTRPDKGGKSDTECNEVWISNESIEYRRFGATVAEGIRRGNW